MTRTAPAEHNHAGHVQRQCQKSHGRTRGGGSGGRLQGAGQPVEAEAGLDEEPDVERNHEHHGDESLRHGDPLDSAEVGAEGQGEGECDQPHELEPDQGAGTPDCDQKVVTEVEYHSQPPEDRQPLQCNDGGKPFVAVEDPHQRRCKRGQQNSAEHGEPGGEREVTRERFFQFHGVVSEA